jgi:hypothetical protein
MPSGLPAAGRYGTESDESDKFNEFDESAFGNPCLQQAGVIRNYY